jgi:hypothetical protein
MYWNELVSLKSLTICLFVVALLGVTIASNAAHANLVWINGGKKALDESSLRYAIEIFSVAIQARPVDESLIYGLGMLQINAGEADAALQTLHSGERYYPTSQRLARAMLLAQIYSGDTTNIVSLTVQAGLKPEILLDVANARMAESQWQQAISLFEAAYADQGTLTPKNRFLLGEAYRAVEDIDHATSNFLVIVSDPQADAALRSEANASLGSIMFWRAPDKAAAYISKALELIPGNADALMLAGDFAFLQRGDRASMNHYFEAAIEVDAEFAADWLTTSIAQSERKPDPRWAWLGAALDILGDPCAALDAYMSVGEPIVTDERIKQVQSKCSLATSDSPKK